MKKLSILLLMLFMTLVNAQVGTTCANPIVISSLPYTTTDDTANYADNYDPPTSSSPSCTTTTSGNWYHGGNDVIYSYTPTTSGTIKIEMPGVVGWTAIFVYTDCANIGVNYAACSTSTSSGTRTINNFQVTAGQTYYILLSSWPSPQTFTYTLNVTQISLGVNDAEKEAIKNVKVYPNPSDRELNFKSDKDIVTANVYTMEGKKVLALNKVENNKISIANLSTGSYIVEFTDKSGKVFTKVFIKK